MADQKALRIIGLALSAVTALVTMAAAVSTTMSAGLPM